MRKAVFALVAVLSLAGVACSNQGASEPTTPPPTTQPPATSPPLATSPPASPTAAACTDQTTQPQITLTMVDFAFQPVCIKATGQQSISITNNGKAVHTFTIPSAPGIDVTVAPGAPFNGEAMGLAPGTYQFICRFHFQTQGMVGELQIVAAP